MPINVLMPALSPTMEEGGLAKWVVKEGDKVAAGDVIAEIETDKATMEVEAVDEGTVGKLVVGEGSQGVKVNEVIAILLEEGEDAAALDQAAPPKQEASPHSEPAGSPPATEPAAGYGRGPGAEEAAPSPEPSPEPAQAKADGGGAPDPAPSAANGARLFASPLARRIAKDRGIELAALKGSGPRGRIVKADVEAAEPGAAKPEAKAAPEPKAADAPEAPKAPITQPTASAEAVKKVYADRPFREVQLDGMRKTIAARLSEAKQTIPHFYLRRDIELDALLAFRGELNAKLEPRGVKLSVNDFIIKACALALLEVPGCNAVWAGDRVLEFENADVAVAVAIEGGLFTPVIRDAHAKTLSAISAEMKDLAKRARERKLAPHEYQGGAFAISNLGMFGIDNFDAVINPPHASILAVGGGVKKPVVRDAAVDVATVMSATLSVDHRVIDGALGARFLGAVKSALEEPLTMLA